MMDDYVTTLLDDLAREQSDATLASALLYASEEIVTRDELLDGLQEFLRHSGMVAEFQASLDYEARLQYNNFFNLSDEAPLQEFLADLYEEEEDSYDEYHW